jgi:mono/diheme cytochrome c family protein
MSDDTTGRDLVPRPEEPSGAVKPRESDVPTTAAEAAVRLSAGEQAHTVGLTEERATQIVKQSGNARMIAFLAALVIVLFIPLYWLYDIGLPVVGFGGRLEAETEDQYVTDVSRGYALFLANCARCHGDQGQGGVGPALNDQAKLYNALTTTGASGNGHLNPDYLRSVLTDGGRIVCGDPNSIMPAWLEPKGPLNYREVEDLIKFITASKDTTFVYQPQHVLPPETAPPPVTLEGWRDPAYSPPPGATPVPACWRAPAGTATPATPAPVESPGTPESPRAIEIHAQGVSWVDASGAPVSQIAVVDGETIEFNIVNDAGFTHNFHIGSATELSTAPENTDLPGVATFESGTQTFTYTVENLPDQPQFACTVIGHYQSMNGNIVVQQAGGGTASPAPSAGPSAAPSPPASAAAPTAAP